jgi:hypothetical protein
MPLLQDDHSTKDDWFKAECARTYSDAGDNEWNSRHVALADWGNVWNSKDGPEADSSLDLDTILYDQCTLTFEAIVKSDNHGTVLRHRAEQYRMEFEVLSKRWQRDTKHLSLVSRKLIHPAFLRIVGMGEPVIPLLLEALRDRPAHWFVALRATANVNPVPENANPSEARQAWLQWGRSQGYIE